MPRTPRQNCRGLGAGVPRQKCRGWRVLCGRCKRFIGSLRIGGKCQECTASKVPRKVQEIPRQKCRGLGAEVPRQKCRGWRVLCGRCKRFIESLRIVASAERRGGYCWPLQAVHWEFADRGECGASRWRGRVSRRVAWRGVAAVFPGRRGGSRGVAWRRRSTGVAAGRAAVVLGVASGLFVRRLNAF